MTHTAASPAAANPTGHGCRIPRPHHLERSAYANQRNTGTARDVSRAQKKKDPA